MMIMMMMIMVILANIINAYMFRVLENGYHENHARMSEKFFSVAFWSIALSHP
jgi:uncharacterized membrane protein